MFEKRFSIVWAIAVLVLAGGSSIIVLGQPDSNGTTIAHGGGTTIVAGGTGSPSFTPVLTKLGFHTEKKGGLVSGRFECLALAPATATGPGSGEFNVNAMYVTGEIKTASAQGDTATLTGTATITGLGAGTNVPFTFTVQRGGPGAKAVLRTEGATALIFNEILIQGAFHVAGS